MLEAMEWPPTIERVRHLTVTGPSGLAPKLPCAVERAGACRLGGGRTWAERPESIWRTGFAGSMAGVFPRGQAEGMAHHKAQLGPETISVAVRPGTQPG